MTEVVEEVDELEQITPKAQQYTYTIAGVDYVQKPLSFYGKTELLALLGKAVRSAMDNGLTLDDVIGDTDTVRGAITKSEFAEADQFISSLALILEFAPEMTKDFYAIALAVPRWNREQFSEDFELNSDEGGITDEDALQVIDVFVEQNWEVLRDFGQQKILPLVKRLFSQAPESDLSKPSSPTPPRTRKPSKN